MKNSTKKTYDCVSEIRKIRDEMVMELKGKTTEEILLYFGKQEAKPDNNIDFHGRKKAER